MSLRFGAHIQKLQISSHPGEGRDLVPQAALAA
jgi:hypothetical protein